MQNLRFCYCQIKDLSTYASTTDNLEAYIQKTSRHTVVEVVLSYFTCKNAYVAKLEIPQCRKCE